MAGNLHKLCAIMRDDFTAALAFQYRDAYAALQEWLIVLGTCLKARARSTLATEIDDTITTTAFVSFHLSFLEPLNGMCALEADKTSPVVGIYSLLYDDVHNGFCKLGKDMEHSFRKRDGVYVFDKDECTFVKRIKLQFKTVPGLEPAKSPPPRPYQPQRITFMS